MKTFVNCVITQILKIKIERKKVLNCWEKELKVEVLS